MTAHRIARSAARGGIVGFAIGLVALPTTLSVIAWMAAFALISSACTMLGALGRRT